MSRDRISFFRSIGGKITLMFVFVVFTTIGALTILSIYQSSQALMKKSFEGLTAIREVKKTQIETLFSRSEEDMHVLVNMVAALQQSTFDRLSALHANKAVMVENYLRTAAVPPPQVITDQQFIAFSSGIIGERSGLGVSGESYLVERRNGRIYFRSEMTTMGNGRYVPGYDLTDIAPVYLLSALDGQSTKDVFSDSAGNLVAVVSTPVPVPGMNLAMVTKISLAEGIVLNLKGHNEDILTEYVETYGFYDLFLIHPNGHIFYSVAKEKDFGTNIISGEYADSPLGDAARSALDSKALTFADFRPYEPSDGEPASFLVQPMIHSGEVELLIGLQLSLDRINSIMQERSGMGETGETYLVGQDKLMRSDSYLDPVNHSVAASFARPETGSVDTDASREALGGVSGEQIVIDYNGNPVLSSYTDINVFGIEWALLSEIDEAEVRAPIRSLVKFIIIGSIAMLAAAEIAAILFSLTISRPIMLLVSGAGNLALGDIDLSDVDPEKFRGIRNRSDELGVIG
ncbi:MAG: cache domain-containing protein, partial [Spirochaetaceae bacterium]|nr:cache domain-containing protein [Spirochaetaceae bacterium]